MSFDLVVLAVEPAASLDDMRRMIEHCASLVHRDGHPDPRIVGFYEELQESFPDHPPCDPESPWMSAPLSVDTDQVSMNINHSPRRTEAVQAVCQLAERHGLVIYDPQGDEFQGRCWSCSLLLGGRRRLGEPVDVCRRKRFGSFGVR